MWIDNYDDPPEPTYEEALALLARHNYGDVTETANKQNNATVFKVFLHPHGRGVYYCHDENEVAELAFNEGLWLIEYESVSID